MFRINAHVHLERLNENCSERALYDIITREAVGHENAISKEELQTNLADCGHNCSKRLIASQIAASRKFPHYLGIKRFGGIYIIDNEEDARITMDYYNEQIQGILAHRNYLQSLCRNCGWNIF